MPFVSMRLAPGVNTEATPIANSAGITESESIRFRTDGQRVMLEKLGGWARYSNFAAGSRVCSIHPWQDLLAVGRLAVGCEQQLAVVSGNETLDITPTSTTSNVALDFSTTSGSPTVTIVDANSNVNTQSVVVIKTPVLVGGIRLLGAYQISSVITATEYAVDAGATASATVSGGGALPTFTTTSGSATVTVNWTGHGYSVGDTFSTLVSVTGNGITLYGGYTVTGVPSANAFTIQASAQANASSTFSMNSGQVQAVYYYYNNPGTAATGYSVGGYMAGGYGSGYVPAGTGTKVTATDWEIENFGSILVAVLEDGPAFYWDPASGASSAAMIPNSPVINAGGFVNGATQQIITYGASADGIPAPLRVAWCTPGDITVWRASTGNQAGSYPIKTGSRIVGGMAGALQNLLWTDLSLWAMQYVGGSAVYGFNEVNFGCGLIAKHAKARLGSAVYWMGISGFFVFANGGVKGIPCPVWDRVFQNLHPDYHRRVVAWPNSNFTEVWWFYPSAGGTGEVDAFVKYNIALNLWDYGEVFARTAAIDQSILGNPIAADPVTGYLFQHESGTDADTSPLTARFKTGFMALAEGQDKLIIDRVRPDAKWGLEDGMQDAQLRVTLHTLDEAGGTPRAYGPYTVDRTTPFFNPRARGRYAAVEVESIDLGSFFRLGEFKLRVAQDGR